MSLKFILTAGARKAMLMWPVTHVSLLMCIADSHSWAKILQSIPLSYGIYSLKYFNAHSRDTGWNIDLRYSNISANQRSSAWPCASRNLVRFNPPMLRLLESCRCLIYTGYPSYEFFMFPSYHTNVSATTQCEQNLKDLSGSWPPIRIGGTTQ